jgi:hemerythrin
VAVGLFLWGQHYLTGIDEIDHQHEEITILLNELHDLRRSLAPRKRQGQALDSLISAVGEHFRTEESIMREACYEGFELHKLDHDAFVGKALAMRAQFESGQDDVLDGGLEFVKDWLRDHMLTSDRRMGRALTRN